jgi:hypothetical protein
MYNYIKYEINNDHSVPSSTSPNYGLYFLNSPPASFSPAPAVPSTHEFRENCCSQTVFHIEECHHQYYYPGNITNNNNNRSENNIFVNKSGESSEVNFENFIPNTEKFNNKKNTLKLSEENFEFSNNLLQYESEFYSLEKLQNFENKTKNIFPDATKQPPPKVDEADNSNIGFVKKQNTTEILKGLRKVTCVGSGVEDSTENEGNNYRTDSFRQNESLNYFLGFEL